jgi:predicted Zn finger-like uncharacterized protein
MKINCPQCHTGYEVNLASLGAKGRTVRCARCQTVWFATPASAAASDDLNSPHTPAAPGGMPPGFRVVSGGGPAAETVLVQEADASAAAFSRIQPPAAPHLGDDAAFAAQAEPAANEDARETTADEAWSVGESVAEKAPVVPSPDAVVPAAERITATPEDQRQSEPEPETQPEPAAAQLSDVESIAARRIRSRVGQRRTKRPRADWRISRVSAAILALATIDAALIAFRGDVVRLLPQTASLFAAIGLPVNLRHLAFDSIHTAREWHDGVNMLVVEGVIRATGADVVDVPRMRFAIQAGNGHEVYAWTALPTRTKLARGEKLVFRTRLASPPEQGQKIQVRFFNRHDLAAGSG